MAKNAQRFKFNTDNITHQRVNGEVIIVSLENGNYYSLGKGATEIWNLLEKNYSTEEIIKACGQRYSGDTSAITNGVNRFISELLGENLITPTKAKAKTAKVRKNVKKIPFEKPVLQKYSDMQEFLLIDPIHEVNIQGWPHVKPNEENKS